MKRFATLALVICFTAAPIFAEGKEGGEAEGGSLQIWKWANFLVLAGGLGYLIGKKGGPFFAARSLKIRKDMVDAGDVRNQAEARAAEVERRLANLEAEIAALRADSGKEEEAEAGLFGRHTAAEIAKTQANAQQEIAAAGKAARLELKRYCADLAVGLAEQKIRARMTPDTQDALVRGFVRDLR
jgi:F-type H+-transporting ATPase subunit b